MNADDIRKEILFQAYARRPLALTASSVHRQCRKEQMDCSLSQIARELPFLVGERLLQIRNVPGVTEAHYEITSEGVRHYEQNFAA
jgi:hypothetical protein